MPDEFELPPADPVFAADPVDAELHLAGADTSTEIATEVGAAPEPPLLAPVSQPLREPFWGYSDVALIVGLMFAFLLAGGFAMIAAYKGNPPIENPVFLIGSQIAVYALLLIAFKLVMTLRYRQPTLRSLGWRPSRFNLAIAGGAGVVLAFVISAVAAALHTPKVNSVIEQMLRSKSTLLWFGLLAVTLAPFFEELFFRGFLQPLFARTFGVIAGILITALLFGAVHAPEYEWAWQYIVAVTLVGVVLGFIRARSNSIIPTTVLHACYNGVFVVAAAFTNHG